VVKTHATLPGNPFWEGRISTVGLHLLTSLDKLLLFLMLDFFFFYKRSYLNEEVNRTDTFTSVRVPWSLLNI
jgi:hypothetical protein